MKKDNVKQPTLAKTLIWIWRQFASIKLAVILLMVLAGLGLRGTFVAPVIFFYTIWFWLPSSLLMLNILICSINRWKSILATIRGGPIRHPGPFYIDQTEQTAFFDLAKTQDTFEPILINSLRRLRYRVRCEDVNGTLYVASDKNRFFKLGTYFSHLSLILFVLAALLGSIYGFRENSFVMIEGETKEIGHETGLSIQLVSFTDEYDADGTPKDYRSEIRLQKNGQEVQQALLRVNHPLIFEGIRVYQSFFGPAIRIQMRQDDQDTIHRVALSDLSQGQGYRRYAGLLDLSESGLSFRFQSSAVQGIDPMIPKGQLALELSENGELAGRYLLIKGEPLDMGEIELTYLEDIQYSGFQISHDPTNFLIWIAAALFLIGTTSVLFFPWRQLWMMVQPLKHGQHRLYIHWGNARVTVGDSDPSKIRQTIQNLQDQSKISLRKQAIATNI